MIRLNERARTLLAVVSTFVIGFVVGCGTDRTILSSPAQAVAGATQNDVARHHEEVLNELRTELGLSAEQEVRVREIFNARQTEVETAWQQVHANLQRAMQQTTTEVEAMLDSAQVQRLRAWIAERHGPTHGSRSPREHGSHSPREH